MQDGNDGFEFKRRRESDTLAVRLDEERSKMVRVVMKEEGTTASSAANGLVQAGYMAYLQKKGKPAVAGKPIPAK